MAAGPRPRLGGLWSLAYFVVCLICGLVAAAFGQWGEGLRTWITVTLACTVVAGLALVAFGGVRRRAR